MRQHWIAGLLLLVMIAPACADIAVAAPATRPADAGNQEGFPPRVLADQPVEGGEVNLIELSNGVVAERIFKNAGGKPLRRILYIPNRRPFALSPAAAKDALLEHSTVVYTYDTNDQLVLEATYGGQRKLFSSVEHSYWPNGKAKLIVRKRYSKGQGVVLAEDRYTAEGDKTSLLWSGNGLERRLVSMGGLVPGDVDLPNGWGVPALGLQCGIVADQAAVCLIVKNVSSMEQPLPQGEMDKLVRPELISAESKTLPYDQEQIRKHLAGSTRHGPRALKAHHAATEFYVLSEWYGKIPPGKYKLSLRRLTDNGQFGLVSNTLDIEISAPTAILTADQEHLCLELDGHSMEVSSDKVVEHGSGLTDTVAMGISMTVEGVSVAATPGEVKFSCAAGTWTASLADGQVRLIETGHAGASRGQHAQQFRLKLYQGQVEVLRVDASASQPFHNLDY